MTRILLFLLLSACAQVRVVTPNPRVETPEVRGDALKWKFGVSGGDAHMFYATGEGGKRPPDLSQPQVRGHLDVHPNAAFQPIAPLEVGGELNTLGTGMNGLVKWQFLGTGHRHAEEGDFAAAIFLRTGFVQSSNQGDQENTFGAGGSHWTSKTKNSFLHAGVSVGHHVSHNALIFAGVAGGNYWAHATVNQDPTSTDPGGTYQAGYRGHGLTEAIGAMFIWKKVQFYFSGEYTQVDYGPTDDMESLFVNTGVTFTPGESP